MKISKLVGLLLTAVMAIQALAACTPASSASEFVVYKDPQCGCCSKWIEHMESAGFKPEPKDTQDLSGIKREFGLKPDQQSCHTGVWSSGDKRYVFEGHIPASLVQRFLDAPPQNARGLLVPGMPVGSPGMEYGDQRMPYEVLLLKNDGSTEVYARIE